jgi:hypothetical protein
MVLLTESLELHAVGVGFSDFSQIPTEQMEPSSFLSSG